MAFVRLRAQKKNPNLRSRYEKSPSSPRQSRKTPSYMRMTQASQRRYEEEAHPQPQSFFRAGSPLGGRRAGLGAAAPPPPPPAAAAGARQRSKSKKKKKKKKRKKSKKSKSKTFNTAHGTDASDEAGSGLLAVSRAQVFLIEPASAPSSLGYITVDMSESLLKVRREVAEELPDAPEDFQFLTLGARTPLEVFEEAGMVASDIVDTVSGSLFIAAVADSGGRSLNSQPGLDLRTIASAYGDNDDNSKADRPPSPPADAPSDDLDMSDFTVSSGDEKVQHEQGRPMSVHAVQRRRELGLHSQPEPDQAPAPADKAAWDAAAIVAGATRQARRTRQSSASGKGKAKTLRNSTGKQKKHLSKSSSDAAGIGAARVSSVGDRDVKELLGPSGKPRLSLQKGAGTSADRKTRHGKRHSLLRRRKSTTAIDLKATASSAHVARSMVRDLKAHMLTEFGSHYRRVDRPLRISFKRFQQAFPMPNRYRQQNIFSLFAENVQGRNGTKKLLSVHKFVANMEALLLGTWEQQIHFVFRLYDEDHDGKLTLSEVNQFLKAELQATGVDLENVSVDGLAESLFEDLRGDSNNMWFIDCRQFRDTLIQKPQLVRQMVRGSLSWLPDKNYQVERRSSVQRCCASSYAMCHRGQNTVLVLFLWALVNCLVFSAVLVRHVTDGLDGWMVVGRAFGSLINLNVSFTIVLGLRKLIVHVDHGPMGRFLPLPKAADWHRSLTAVVLLCSAIHAICFMVYAAQAAGSSDGGATGKRPVLWKWFFSLDSEYHDKGATGCLLLLLLVCIGLAGLPWVVERGFFRLRHYVHRLYIPWIGLLLFHSMNSWVFLGLPGLLLLLEVLSRLLAQPSYSNIEQAIAMPSGVSVLAIRKEHFFHHRPGQYVYISIPAIAKDVWRPFHITSRPEKEAVFTVHIPSTDAWSRHLFDRVVQWQANESLGVYFQPAQPGGLQLSPSDREFKDSSPRSMSSGDEYAVDVLKKGGHVVVDLPSRDNVRQRVRTTRGRFSLIETRQSSNRPSSADYSSLGRQFRVLIDGPWGHPAEDIYKADHAILIGMEEGVVPFASILTSVWHQHRRRLHSCSECSNKWIGDHYEKSMFDDRDASFRLAKVDFFWVSQQLTPYEWLQDVVATLEEDQGTFEEFEKFLNHHIYFTGDSEPNRHASGLAGTQLEMALNSVNLKVGRDVLPELQRHTHYGHPDWVSTFKEFRGQNWGKVTVFCAASEEAAQPIRRLCVKFRFGFRSVPWVKV